MEIREVMLQSGRLNSQRKRYLACIFAATIVSCAIIFLTISLTPQFTKPFASDEAHAAPGKCALWAGKVYSPTQFGPVPIRWGNSKFGVRHIRAGNKPWGRYQSIATNYILNYGYVTKVQGTKQVVEGRFDGKKWRVVFSNSRGNCPNARLDTGIITVYRIS